MVLIDIPHIVGHEIKQKSNPDGGWEPVLVAFTDLELDVLHPEHDKAAVDKLKKDLASHIEANPHHKNMELETRRSQKYA